jgi:hypothetical protein
MSARAASSPRRQQAALIGEAVRRSVLAGRHVTVNLWLPEEVRGLLLAALMLEERNDDPRNGGHKGGRTKDYVLDVNTWPREDS